LIDRLFRTPEGEAAPLPDLVIRSRLTVPVSLKGDSKKSVTRSEVIVIEGGRLVRAESRFDPPLGPLPIFDWQSRFPIHRIPIFGAFFRASVRRVWVDPGRRLMAEGEAFGIRARQEQGNMLFGCLGVESSDFGQDPNFRVPQKVSGLARIVMTGLLRRKRGEGPKGQGPFCPVEVVPHWAGGEIELTGDFSDRVIEIDLERTPTKSLPRKMRLFFSGKIPGKHRISIKGPMTSPTLEIVGLAAVEYQHTDRVVRVTNQLPDPSGAVSISHFQIALRIDPSLKVPPYSTLNWDQKSPIVVEELSANRKVKLATLRLPQGARLEDFRVLLEGTTPRVRIKRVETPELLFEGHGVSLQLRPALPDSPSDGRPAVSSVEFNLSSQGPILKGRLSGHLMGRLIYARNGRRQGLLEFESLEDPGEIEIGRNGLMEGGPVEVTISGRSRARFPQIEFVSHDEQFRAESRQRLRDAVVAIDGRLSLIPSREYLRLISKGEGLTLSARSANLWFRQETHQFLPHLEKYLPDGVRERLRSEFQIVAEAEGHDPPPYRFVADEMILAPGDNGQALEIQRADFRMIHIQGLLTGQMVLFHTDLGFPLVMTTRAPMRTRLSIGRLVDKRFVGPDGATERVVSVTNPELVAEEIRPTLSAEEQAACGFDRQRIRGKLALFGFSPETHQLVMKRLAPDAVVEAVVSGACLSIGGRAP